MENWTALNVCQDKSTAQNFPVDSCGVVPKIAWLFWNHNGSNSASRYKLDLPTTDEISETASSQSSSWALFKSPPLVDDFLEDSGMDHSTQSLSTCRGLQKERPSSYMLSPRTWSLFFLGGLSKQSHVTTLNWGKGGTQVSSQWVS